MNKKRIVIISIIVVLLISAISFAIYKNQKNKNQTTNLKVTPIPTSQLPTSYPVYQKPEGLTIEISGVEINNIYNLNPQINERKDATFKTSDQYQLIYFSKENEFLISILASPFDQIRLIAEQDFLKILGINTNQACKLQVIISTPLYVNPNEAGKNYRLSFCK